MKTKWMTFGIVAGVTLIGCAKSAEPEADVNNSAEPQATAPALDPPPLDPAGGNSASIPPPAAAQGSPRGEELSINPAGKQHQPGSK